MEGIIFLGCVIGVLVAIGLLISHILTCVSNSKELKDRRNHPIFYGKAEERCILMKQNIRFHNEKIAPLKNKISKSEEKLQFLPFGEKVKEQVHLELLKEELFRLENEYSQMTFEENALLEELREYAQQNNIRWW